MSVKKGKVRFKPTSPNEFHATLNRRVEAFFIEKGISQNANAHMIWKTIILLSMYFLPFIALLAGHFSLPIALVFWTLIGAGKAGIGMSVMHDALHGAYSNNKKLNEMMGWALNLLGASIFNWRVQHNLLHHTFTNIEHHDEDMDIKELLRFSPHKPHRPWHRFQHIYCFGLYAISTLFWCTGRDFLLFFKYKNLGFNPQTLPQNVVSFGRIILLKICYLGVIFGLPIAFFGFSFFEIMIGFLWMHVVAGVFLSLVFQCAHTVEGTNLRQPDGVGTIEEHWAINQIENTVNFAPNHRVWTWFFGGLNYQVEHHLFPRVCHVHYPKIAPIVQATAKEFGLPYHQIPTFGRAIKSHIATLWRYGQS